MTFCSFDTVDEPAGRRHDWATQVMTVTPPDRDVWSAPVCLTCRDLLLAKRRSGRLRYPSMIEFRPITAGALLPVAEANAALSAA